ncbi:hypothetical protein [Salinigranum sp.]|uniref:hypothetical protein n=1 Tax=Salinigranum sp. TaxID=1966351 RepID=UPI0035665183
MSRETTPRQHTAFASTPPMQRDPSRRRAARRRDCSAPRAVDPMGGEEQVAPTGRSENELEPDDRRTTYGLDEST